LDGKGFIADIEGDLVPISPILGHAIRKQLADIGTTADDLSPDEAMDFIVRMENALELFLGRAEAASKRKRMMTLLRKYAPGYFEERSLV
jgi:hypothetical protein